MSIDWEGIGKFVSATGIPFATMLMFLGPIVYAIYRVVNEWGPRIAESHSNFMDSASKSQAKNSETLERLEEAVSQKHIDHQRTHAALASAAQAGLHIIDGRPDDARRKLERIEEILKTDRIER